MKALQDQFITRQFVANNKRIEFLPQFTGKHYLTFESAIYSHMDKSAKNYKGGYWEYYTLSNGGFYMGLDQDEPLKMECITNYFDDEMSADAASLGVNLCILNAFAWQIDAEKFSNHFYLLRDYALEHAEASKILAFID